MQITPRCEQVIENARKASVRLGHRHLSSGHLILGLMTVNGGAAELLAKAGLSLGSVEQDLRAVPIVEEHVLKKRGSEVGISAFDAMQRAESQAIKTNSSCVCTEHILLALLDEESGVASSLLDAHTIERDLMRAALIRRFTDSPIIEWPNFDSPEVR